VSFESVVGGFCWVCVLTLNADYQQRVLEMVLEQHRKEKLGEVK